MSCDGDASVAAALYINILLLLEACLLTNTLQSLVITRYFPVTDELHLRLMRDSLEIRMKNGSFLFASFVISMSIRDGLGIECLSMVSLNVLLYLKQLT